MSDYEFPPLPQQNIKPLEERMADADSFFNQLSSKAIKKIKDIIRQSAIDCGESKSRKEIQRREFPKIADIQMHVARHFNVSVIDMISHRRNTSVVLPRHIAMYLCRFLTTCSTPEIGRRFDGRDHTTILYSVNKITQLIKTDVALADKIAVLKEKLLS